MSVPRALGCGLLASAALLLAFACDSEKSSNPLGPTVAGPIPGVSITPPKPLEPGSGSQISTANQPITLVLENASTNGVRALTYEVELAADVEFSNRVFRREGVEPGSNGKTSLRLPDALESQRTYYWRARAVDGANASSFSATANFAIFTPIVLEAPVPVSPASGSTLASVTRPTLIVRNAPRSGPVGAISYTFQLAADQAFAQGLAQLEVAEQANQTQVAVDITLPYSGTFYWRVRAYDPSVIGPWSATSTFRTPTAPPTPTPPPSPGPGGPYPTSGPEVVRYVETRYPDRLVAGVSSSQRKANMEFVRDRMIEAGICGGMDLALNLKRGGPEISADYITHNKNGRWVGVDIGYDYDNTSTPLRLAWAENPDDPYISPKAYSPRPTCK